jgi:surfactin synthase thioesterase subunit
MHCFETILTASDEEIVEYFSHNSLSDSVPAMLDNSLKRLLNKILCTDVRMAERYKATPEDVTFDCDITVFYGESDPLLQDLDMSTWSRFTTGKCEVYPFEGDHFYYIKCKEAVCDIIKEKICK